MAVDLARIVRHMATPKWRVRRAFPLKTLMAIEQAVQRAEATHAGEIRLAVEGALDGTPLLRGQSARERAIDVFSHLRLWDTADRTGVLIYLLLADRRVEIVADRGIHARVGPEGWGQVCRNLEAALRQGDYEGGAIACIEAVARHLDKHFPGSHRRGNELPNAPVIL